MKQRYLTRLLPLIALFIIPIAQADIQSWRVGHNGLYDAANPPVDWKVNLLFEIPLETKSNGTPILVDGKLFYLSLIHISEPTRPY